MHAYFTSVDAERYLRVPQQEVAREQAAMPITAEDLPDNLKLQPAWPPAPHTAAKVAKRRAP